MPIPWGALTSKILTVAGLLVIASALHLGQDLFVPLALAIFFSLILSPLVGLGQRLRLPRAVSVVTVVALVFGVLGLAGLFIAGEATSLVKKLPEYRSNALAKLEALRGPFANIVSQFREAVKDVGQGTGGAAPKEGLPQGAVADPVKVEVVEGSPDTFKLAGAVLGPLFSAGGVFAVVFLLVVFFLIYETDIRDRVIRLAGDAQVNMTTQAITEATRGVSRFLYLQAVINTSYGIILGLGLAALGVPGALLWGVLAALLRFVPYVGPMAAGLLPVLLSFSVFPGWSRPALVAGLIVVLEVISNNLVEPIMYGKRTGLSPLAVVVAAVFWAWMWGAVGLILSVPLTVCLLSLGKYVPSLRFLEVALGDGPALEPKVQVYHRLLGRHHEEAAELLEKERVGGKSLAEFYDGIVLPVIRMGGTDLQLGKLDEEKAVYLLSAVREIVDDLGETLQEQNRLAGGPADGVRPEQFDATVVCLPASDKADELSAIMLSQVLNLGGCRAVAVPVEKLAGETLDLVEAEKADVLVICTSPPSNLLRTRYLYKRLRRKFGNIPIVEGVWGGGDVRTLGNRISPDGRATLVLSFVEAEKVVAGLSREAALRTRLHGDGLEAGLVDAAKPPVH